MSGDTHVHSKVGIMMESAHDALFQKIQEIAYQLCNVIALEGDVLAHLGELDPPELQIVPPTSNRELARFIDHTLLKAEATAAQIEQLCLEALQWGFAAVCVNPTRVEHCARLLRGSKVHVASVVGFPLGGATATAKANEASEAVGLGARELDMVLNIGRLKDQDWAAVRRDIEAVVEAAGGAIVKVILETCLLTEEEKIAACLLARAAGVDFVKTSTGLAGDGAKVEDVRLMRRVVGRGMGVKAAGGIRDASTACAMLAAGASRLGSSNSVAIVREP